MHGGAHVPRCWQAGLHDTRGNVQAMNRQTPGTGPVPGMPSHPLTSGNRNSFNQLPASASVTAKGCADQKKALNRAPHASCCAQCSPPAHAWKHGAPGPHRQLAHHCRGGGLTRYISWLVSRIPCIFYLAACAADSPGLHRQPLRRALLPGRLLSVPWAMPTGKQRQEQLAAGFLPPAGIHGDQPSGIPPTPCSALPARRTTTPGSSRIPAAPRCAPC